MKEPSPTNLILLVDSRLRGNDGRGGGNDVREVFHVRSQPGRDPLQTDPVSASTFGLFSLLVRRSTASAVRMQMEPVHPKLASEP